MPVIKFETDPLIETDTKPIEEKGNLQYIGFVLDGSSSMVGYTEETIRGYNYFVYDLAAKLGTNGIFTSFLFIKPSMDGYKTEIIPLSDTAPITQALPINRLTYKPSGGTPLLKTSVGVINKAAKWHQENNTNPPPIIVLQTDGQDNQSPEIKISDFKSLVQRKKRLGWRFILLGAGLNAESMAERFGIDQAAALSYNPAKSYEAFRLAADAVVGSAKRLTAPVFSIEDKRSVK